MNEYFGLANEYIGYVALVVALVGIGYTAYQARQLRKETGELKASMPSRRVVPKTKN